jgi:2-phospho-L-lactate guanylyltransferase
MTRDAIIVPLKRFDLAKDRLREGGVADVAGLAQGLAESVLASCRPRHVIVVSESDEISAFAERHGAEAWRSAARGLNQAVQLAYEKLGDRFDRLLIAHGDLKLPAGLGQFDPKPGVTIVTDRLGQGTNVLVVPTRVDFHFAYGQDSAHHHQLEAQRLGLRAHVITDSPWRFDVDEPADLDDPTDGN